MALVAGAVKLTSRGPVFFKQKRYGLDGRAIDVWKFRSMTVCENGAVVTQATKQDTRFTPIGAFLRKTSLDELPQLLNVLKGDMSLVGPRPTSFSPETYRLWHTERLGCPSTDSFAAHQSPRRRLTEPTWAAATGPPCRQPSEGAGTGI